MELAYTKIETEENEAMLFASAEYAPENEPEENGCEMTAEEAEEAVERFDPLIKSLALKYEGQGAETQDLVQIGRIALIRIVPKMRKDKYFLNRLQRRMRRIINFNAEILRKQKKNLYGESVPITEEIELLAGEDRGVEWAERETDMFEKVELLLTPEERSIVFALYEGKSRRQIAAGLQVSHMTVVRRLERIQEKLNPLKGWLLRMAGYRM